MSERTFPTSDFLARFPEFGNTTKYPTATVENAGAKALLHIAPEEEGMPMLGNYRNYALFLMAAHLLELDDTTTSAGSSGVAMAGTPFKAQIGSVQIENSKQNSFTTDDWNYWLGQTKHGRELLAFLDTQAPCGVFLNTECDSVRDLV